MIVGNKIDVPEEQRLVSNKEGLSVAEKYGLQFLEVSAYTGVNIDDIFNKMGIKL